MQILFDEKDAIELKKEDEFTTWVMKNVYDRFGAIFIKSTNNLNKLAEHLKPFIHVIGAIFIKSTNNLNKLAEHLKPFIHVSREVEFEEETVTQKGYLAYYDPRVFPNWIESETQNIQAEF